MDHQLSEHLQTHLIQARNRSDELFGLIDPAAMHERPIPERHRIIFYLGHLEAFDWNIVCRNAFGMEPFNADFDRIFSFGIDPTDGNLPQDWPSIAEIRRYNSAVRAAVDRCLERSVVDEDAGTYLEGGLIFRVALEHRLMHAETLAYMLHWLPLHLKRRVSEPLYSSNELVPSRRVRIPAGQATLGARRSERTPFGWDNEFEECVVDVDEFHIDAFKITNGQFLEFLRAGGYEEPAFWSAAGWEWIRTSNIRCPKSWRQERGRWFFRTMFDEVPLPPAWPVYVSHEEASAYACWAGAALPSEAEFHRAAFGSPDRTERRYPWGEEPPQARHGNFDFQRWSPTRVDSHRDGDSAFGVSGLIGNGWEWTSTPFRPLQGFQPFPFYPGYSADFFDGNHYVLKGASSRTASVMLRRSFRNWFQPQYPHIYASFRCVKR
jgi:ergothioneine biosynthesis protein EgtB